VVEGFSHLAIVVAGPTMIAGLADDRTRGFAMTLWSSFFGVAYAALAVIAPLFAGPPGLFLAHGGLMAVLAMVLSRALPADRPGQGARRGGLIAEHAAIYRSPRLAAPAMGFCFYTFLYVALLTLLPPATPGVWGAWVAVGAPLASIAVSLTFGVWALRRVSAVRLVQAGYLLAVPGVLMLWVFWGQGPGMVAGAFAVSAALGIVQGASFASIPELNPGPDDRARAAGAVAQLGNLGTTTGTPVLAALLAGAGPTGLVLASVALCAAGVVVHRIQAARRVRS
jgi:MFS transporter, DHA1 family, inner membrane transport protein